MTTHEHIKLWLECLQEVPEEETKAWVYESLEPKANLHVFATFFFSQIVRDIAPCHLDLIRELSKPEDSAIIYPRGFGKSTWIKIDTLHDIVYKLEPVILFVSSTLRDAQFHFESIKTELENNDALRFVYGDLVPPEADLGRKWTNVHFETKNGVNVVARGVCNGRGVNIKNRRPTKIILDDIEDDEHVRSSEQRAKLHHWLTSVIMPSKDAEKGRIKMPGTVLHYDCELLKFYETNGGIFRKAIEDGRSIWHERWPLEKLEEQRRKMGSVSFAQEYLNDPLQSADTPVKFGSLKLYDGAAPASLTTYAFVDPAISKKQGSDYFVIQTVGVDEDGNIWDLETIREQLSFSAQVDRILVEYQKWGWQRAGVETVAYQAALEQELVRRGNELGIYVPAVPVKPDGDKLRRLLRITPLIENGTIRIRRGNGVLIDELTQFPFAPHDDTVDGLTGAVLLITDVPRPMVTFL